MNRLADLAPCIAAFVLYTNAAVVGVHYHGVPFIFAASYLLLLLVPIARDVLFRGESPVVPPALVYILAFFAVALVGSLFAARPENSAKAIQELALEEVLLYILFVNAIRTPALLKQVVWTLIGAGVFMGALVAFQQFTGAHENEFFGFAQLDRDGRGFRVSDVVDASTPRQQRLTGPIGEPNRFAQIMTVLVPLATLQIYAARRRLAKVLAGAGLLVILLGGSLAFSRGAAVGLALMVIAMVAMGYVKPKHLAAIGIGLVLVALLVPQYGRRLASLGEVAALATQEDGAGMANADGSTRGRLTEMFTAVLVFADHPIVGAGPGMYPEHYMEYARIAGGKVRRERRQAHSLPLHIAAEYGALGLAAFGMALLVTFRDLERNRRRWRHVRPDLAHLAAGLNLALVVYLTTGLFLHMSYARYFWFIFALAGAAGRMATKDERSVVASLVRGIDPSRALSR